MTETLTSRDDHSEHVSYEDKPIRIFPIKEISLDKIRPHEAVNEPDLRSFCRSFREKGLFYKPILIDRESGTILDGTHRWAGLKDLGANKAPVIPFRYREDDEIEVHTWFPFCELSLSDVLDILNEYDISLEQIEHNQFISGPVSDPIVYTTDSAYRINQEPIPLFHLLEEAIDFQYTDQRSHLHQFVEQGAVGFLRKAPTKQTVVEITQNNENVPPKYTCHRFPYKYPHIMARYEDLVPNG